MPTRTITTSSDADRWLRIYYLLRGSVSLLWVAAALLIGPHSTAIAGVLLLIYPAWDALANGIDARRNGGLRANPTQAVNIAVSSVTTIAVAVTLTQSVRAVIAVFGVWAILSGILQLATGVRRWRVAGAQWLMIISGAQSAAAGANFLREVGAPDAPGVADIAPYAAFGAFYFLVSAAWLVVVAARRARVRS
jgi:uncharacterized membrane protein HdeD (DUF308 family)